MKTAATAAPRSFRAFRLAFAAAAVAILAVPLVTMQFTGEVDWGRGDFLVFAAMLAAAWAGAELALKTLTRPATRLAGIAFVVSVFLAAWAELAVGIFE